MHHDIVPPKSSNPLWRLIPIGIDSILSLGQLAFSQLLILVSLAWLLLNQPGVALLGVLLLPPQDFLTLLTPASASPGQNISLAAGRQRMRALSLDLIFMEAQFIDLCCGSSCLLGLEDPEIALAVVSTHLFFSGTSVDICLTDLLRDF